MNIKLNKYQEALLLNGWSLRIARGIFKLHFYYEKGRFMYAEDDISAERVCKKHRIEATK